MLRLIGLLLLLPSLAFAQGLPNGGVMAGQLWSPLQWNSAWSSKMDGVGGVCNGCSLLNPNVTAGTWTGSTLVNPIFTGTALFPSVSTSGNFSVGGTLSVTGSSTFGTVASVNPTSQIVVKNGPSGNIMMLLGGSSNDIEPRTNITLPGGTWGLGNLLNNAAPIFQNASFSGSSSSSVANFGAFLQQTDNSAISNTNAGVGIYEHLILQSGVSGGREAGQFTLDITQTTANTSPQLYTALGTKCNLNATDGGAGNKSSCFGFNPVASVGAGVTAQQVVGGEIDTWVQAGATVTDRIGLQIVDVTGSTYGVQSSRDDVALSLNNQYAPSSTLGYKVGFEFGRFGGLFPVATNGTLIYGQGTAGSAWTVANGIDWSLGTATGFWLNLGGVYTVTGAGVVSATGYKVGATVGVSCAANTVSLTTLVVTNGIITHC